MRTSGLTLGLIDILEVNGDRLLASPVRLRPRHLSVVLKQFLYGCGMSHIQQQQRKHELARRVIPTYLDGLVAWWVVL